MQILFFFYKLHEMQEIEVFEYNNFEITCTKMRFHDALNL